MKTITFVLKDVADARALFDALEYGLLSMVKFLSDKEPSEFSSMRESVIRCELFLDQARARWLEFLNYDSYYDKLFWDALRKWYLSDIYDESDFWALLNDLGYLADDEVAPDLEEPRLVDHIAGLDFDPETGDFL